MSEQPQISQHITQIVFSNVFYSSTDALYLPRYVGIYSGLHPNIPASLVQRICGSGIEAILAACERIELGTAPAILAGGTENMSQVPVSAYGTRSGFRLGVPGFVDTLAESFMDKAHGLNMGQTAERLAQNYSITREQADQFALESHKRARSAQESGFFEGEIIPIQSTSITREGYASRTIKLPRNVTEVLLDETPRETSLSQLSKLNPVYERNGIHTAGNSSGITDGAVALILGHKDVISEISPLAWIEGISVVALDGKDMGLAPVDAIRLILQEHNLNLDEIDSFEINEAFACQVLSVMEELGLDVVRVNPNGGAIALGHPLAASGARLVLTLARNLSMNHKKWGIASACIGGGQGIAVLLRNPAVIDNENRKEYNESESNF